jgi:hypothetical protein
MLTCYATTSFHHKASHVVIEFSLVEYDMCSFLLLFCIASTQPGCCLDKRFEDFPREFGGFLAGVPLVSYLWRRTFPLLVLVLLRF